MPEVAERSAATAAGACRVWEKGTGAPVCFFAGLGGLPAWLPMLDRLAETRKVAAPSLPGFPGGPDAEPLDDLLDWILAACDAQEAAGVVGGDLIGASVGGALAAEIAAVRPDAVRRLVLIAPFGLFDADDPVADTWAQRPGQQPALLTKDVEAYQAYVAPPDGTDPGDWEIVRLRAEVAAAKILWPLGDTRLAKRLGRIRQKTLLIWGEEDKVIPPSYAKRFAEGIAGETTIRLIPGAGHKVEFDKPTEVAAAIADFLGG